MSNRYTAYVTRLDGTVLEKSFVDPSNKAMRERPKFDKHDNLYVWFSEGEDLQVYWDFEEGMKARAIQRNPVKTVRIVRNDESKKGMIVAEISQLFSKVENTVTSLVEQTFAQGGQIKALVADGADTKGSLADLIQEVSALKKQVAA